MPKGVKTSVRGREAGKGRVAEPLGVDGNVRMKADEALRLLEKHEEECNRRYAKIEKSLDAKRTPLQQKFNTPVSNLENDLGYQQL